MCSTESTFSRRRGFCQHVALWEHMRPVVVMHSPPSTSLPQERGVKGIGRLWPKSPHISYGWMGPGGKCCSGVSPHTAVWGGGRRREPPPAQSRPLRCSTGANERTRRRASSFSAATTNGLCGPGQRKSGQVAHFLRSTAWATVLYFRRGRGTPS